MSAHDLLNLLTDCEIEIQCSTSLAFYLFFVSSLMNYIIKVHGS